MAETKQNKNVIKVRAAEPADARLASKLLSLSFPDFSTYGPGLNKDERAKNIYEKTFPLEKHRFSYKNAQVAEIHGQKAGLVVSFNGQLRRRLNFRLAHLLLKAYRLKGKWVLLRRLFPMTFMEETRRDDWVLSNIAVLPKHQGQGVGKALLKAAEKQARADGCKRMVAMVGIQNTSARKFFEHLGYKVTAISLESNRRVKMFGPGYHRMVKKL